MQSINQLTTKLQATTKPSATLTNSVLKSEPSMAQASSQAISEPSVRLLELITDMFEDWKRVFGAKLQERQVLDVRTTELWAIALQGLRITPAEFNTALAKSLTLKWPPTAPADFLELARAGKQSEYLDIQTAFETACRCAGMRGDVERDWRHPTVLETASRIGWGKLASAGNGFIKYFATVYERVISEHKNGANFEIPKTHRIEAPKPARLNDDSPIAQDWEKMKARFGVGRPRQETVEV